MAPLTLPPPFPALQSTSQTWHGGSSASYGEGLAKDDTIGVEVRRGPTPACCLLQPPGPSRRPPAPLPLQVDLDGPSGGTLEFFKNGRGLGIAFEKLIDKATAKATAPLFKPAPAAAAAAAPASDPSPAPAPAPSAFTGLLPAVGLYTEGDSVAILGLKTGFGSHSYSAEKGSAAARAGAWHRFIGWWAAGQQHGPGLLLVRSGGPATSLPILADAFTPDGLKKDRERQAAAVAHAGASRAPAPPAAVATAVAATSAPFRFPITVPELHEIAGESPSSAAAAAAAAAGSPPLSSDAPPKDESHNRDDSTEVAGFWLADWHRGVMTGPCRWYVAGPGSTARSVLARLPHEVTLFLAAPAVTPLLVPPPPLPLPSASEPAAEAASRAKALRSRLPPLPPLLRKLLRGLENPGDPCSGSSSSSGKGACMLGGWFDVLPAPAVAAASGAESR